MRIDERYKYLRKMQERYRAATHTERSQLLDEMQAVTELHRKSLVRLMNSTLQRTVRCRQRGRTYGPQVADALRVISESFDHICAERLAPNLVWMASHLEKHGELEVDQELLEKLGRISVSTVRRIQERLRQDQRRLPRKSRPGRAHALYEKIPEKRIPWDEQVPGHFEVDSVHHCGSHTEGLYVHTIQMVDVATGWSERVATLGRSYRVMKDGFQRILGCLPFSVKEFHPDNGSEFLNDHLLRFWQTAVPKVAVSRSRPRHKNDNRFVEHRNGSLVRAYLGYQRLDTVAQTLLLNQLYDKMWLYYNFFQPILRLKAKTPLPSSNGRSPRIQRRYDEAKAPLDRLLDRQVLSSEKERELRAWRAATNPRTLRQEIYLLLAQLDQLPNAVPGSKESVFDTLLTSDER